MDGKERLREKYDEYKEAITGLEEKINSLETQVMTINQIKKSKEDKKEMESQLRKRMKKILLTLGKLIIVGNFMVLLGLYIGNILMLHGVSIEFNLFLKSISFFAPLYNSLVLIPGSSYIYFDYYFTKKKCQSIITPENSELEENELEISKELENLNEKLEDIKDKAFKIQELLSAIEGVEMLSTIGLMKTETLQISDEAVLNYLNSEYINQQQYSSKEKNPTKSKINDFNL